jgi:hypothetical protein
MALARIRGGDMSSDDKVNQKPNQKPEGAAGDGTLDDEALDQVVGGAHVQKDHATTMTSIALAESGGSTQSTVRRKGGVIICYDTET